MITIRKASENQVLFQIIGSYVKTRITQPVYPRVSIIATTNYKVLLPQKNAMAIENCVV